MQNYLYYSRLPEYKQPYGAVEEGTKIKISIRIRRTEALGAALRVSSSDDRECVFPMKWTDLDREYDVFSAEFIADMRGTLQYCFDLRLRLGSVTLGRDETDPDGSAIVGGVPWTITVTPTNVKTPDISDGVIYQIFVDRFRRGKFHEQDGFFEPKLWGEAPVLVREGDGIIYCRDIYGGDLRGVEDALGHIASLGVTTIYLSPIFSAWSNHKYNTADYEQIDPCFGDEEDFKHLIARAKEFGIRIILDGVFSHTGADSKYFDKTGRYGNHGAYSDPNSPYRSWYRFCDNPPGYECWWGVPTLPCVEELDPNYLDYIIRGENSIIARWTRLGIGGWRLDVADELPDEFIRLLRERVREINPDAVVIGEVWEDASTKVAYDVKRRYFADAELDGTMNYPLRDAIFAFLRGKSTGREAAAALNTILENYPCSAWNCLMNLIGTHDTRRLRTELGEKFSRFAAALQYAFPGAPSLFYGDEVGMEGADDPDNRRCFPWSENGTPQGDARALRFWRKLGRLKRKGAFSGECRITGDENTLTIRRDGAEVSVDRNGTCFIREYMEI